MNQLTISAANAAARVASVDRDVASSLGAAECSSLSLSLSFSFVICICIQAFISASSPTRSLTLPLFLPFCISISLSLSLSLCGEWRGTESCRKHYVKWPPWLKIHPPGDTGNSSRQQQQQAAAPAKLRGMPQGTSTTSTSAAAFAKCRRELVLFV